MILLEACVLLNLCATDRLEEIGQCFPGGLSVAAAARAEALFLRDPADAAQPLKPLALDPFFQRGIRLFANFGGDPKRLWSTPSMVKTWADSASPDGTEQGRAVRAIRDRARYVPAASHPLYPWWSQLMAQ